MSAREDAALAVRDAFEAALRGEVETFGRLLTVHETAQMRGTDVLLDRDLTYLWTLRGEAISFARVFKTHHEGLEAAGLS